MSSPNNTELPEAISQLIRRVDGGDILTPEEIEQLVPYGRCPECGRLPESEGFIECGTFHGVADSQGTSTKQSASTQQGPADGTRAESGERGPEHAARPRFDPRKLNPAPDQAQGEQLMRAFFRAVTASGEVREVRIPKPLDKRDATISGYFNAEDAFVRELKRYRGEHLAEGVYATLNPVNPALLARSPNELTVRAELTTTDKDIPRRRFLFIDVDPTRPAGISATISERNAALTATAAIDAYLGDLGFPHPVIIGSSGNGGVIIYRIDLPNDPESKRLIEGVLEHLRERFNTDAIEIDPAVSNAARLIRVPGTVAAKGKHCQDRPHRVAVVEIDSGAGTITREQLEALAGPPPQDEKSSGWQGNDDGAGSA